MGNSTLPIVCDKLNVMASIHNRKLIAALASELNQKDLIINKQEERIEHHGSFHAIFDSKLLHELPKEYNEEVEPAYPRSYPKN